MTSEEIRAVESIKEVVQIIDNGGTDSESSEEVAASYAYLSSKQNDNPTEDHLQTALHALMEKGAIFDYELALEYAKSILIETLNRDTGSQQPDSSK